MDDVVDSHFFPREKRIEDLKNQWGRSSLEVLGLFNDAAARRMGLEDAE